MKNIVYKYQLTTDLDVGAPQGKVVLFGRDNRDILCVWIEHPLGALIDTIYSIVGTGQSYDTDQREHVATAYDGGFVWHLLKHV